VASGPLTVAEYVAAIAPEHRALFGRINDLIVDAFPSVEVVLSYQIPTYKVGARRLHVGLLNHGLSMYGWDASQDGGFTSRHPGLRSSKGTLRLRPSDAAAISDDEFRALIGSALGG
jgi:hypothetical protein